MKFKGFFLLTLQENFKGQIVWIAIAVGLFVLGLGAFLSGAAVSHQDRMFDTTSYFVIDLVVFFTSCIIGSQVYSKDFSNRGICELLIPKGTSRVSILSARILSHLFLLFPLVIFMYVFRFLGFFFVAALEMPSLALTISMVAYTWLKACAGFTLAAFLGCLVRPVVALLGSITLFFLGHYQAGVTALADNGNDEISQSTQNLIQIFKFWNPNFLVVQSYKGVWEQFTGADFLMRVCWGVLIVGCFFFFALSASWKRDIDSLQL
jgi:hypothetical protein